MNIIITRLKSPLLFKLLNGFPELEEQLTFYESSFDRTKALKDGVVVPNRGVNVEYDSLEEAVTIVQKELAQYLKEQQQRLKCKVSASFWFKNCSYEGCTVECDLLGHWPQSVSTRSTYSCSLWTQYARI